MSQTTDIEQDTTSTYSVWVPGSDPSSTGNYLRLGSKDAAFEGANLPNATADELPDPGILLYANNAVQIVAPKFDVTTTEWSAATVGESLSATYDGKLLVSAQWQAPHVASVTYQALMDFNVNVTNTANLIVGNSLTYWLGNDASTGTGSLLWSNLGFTQNIFGGQIVNMINDSLDVQGFGEAKFISTYSVDATDDITFAVSPLAAGGTGAANKFISKLHILAGILAAITTGITFAEATAIGVALDFKNNETAIKDSMIATMASVAAVETGVLVLQALAVAAGLVAKSAAAAATAASTTSIRMEDGQIVLSVGTTYLSLRPTGIAFGGSSVLMDSPVVETSANGINYSVFG